MAKARSDDIVKLRSVNVPQIYIGLKRTLPWSTIEVNCEFGVADGPEIQEFHQSLPIGVHISLQAIRQTPRRELGRCCLRTYPSRLSGAEVNNSREQQVLL